MLGTLDGRGDVRRSGMVDFEAMDAAIEVEHLRVIRGGHRVLPDLTLSVERGSVTGLLGPSGSGKTTLIRCIVGVQVIAGGTVRVLGEPAGSANLRRRIGYVTQAPSVYADITVRENLHYFARILDVGDDDVDRVLETVSLGGFADRIAGNLSGGQRARVSLATALLGQPDLLVLDEPTVGLDPVLRSELWTTFEGLAAAGTTLLVSSHVMDEASHCGQVLLLRDGRLVAAESPARLLEQMQAPDMETAFLRLVEGPPE
jgi:ABC-2 type transport system ATP-binding protein